MIENAGTRAGGTTQTATALLDLAHEPMLALAADGRIIHANSAAAAALGHAQRHLIGKPFPALVGLADRRKVRKTIREIGDEPQFLELTLEHGSASASLRQLPDVQPRVVGVTLDAHRPVPPEHHDVPADLSVALDRFFLRFSYGVVGLGADHRVLFGNPRARQLLGEEGLRIGRTLPAGSLRDFADRTIALPSVTQAVRLELPGGRVLRVSGLGGRGREPAILMLEDVTERERRDDMLREFVRNAAHQLRTPVTGIAAAVEILQAGAKNQPEERDRFLQHVEVHAQRLIRIARGLLVLARAQSGEPMRLELVELRPMLDELAAASTPHPGVELVVDCKPSLAVLAERDLTHEALAAILENAVAHTRQGSIRLSAMRTNGDGVAISITDTGAGILPEHRDRIFEPFYRPDASGDGFGLGLSIAAQAVNAMDGELAIEDVERGSRFTVRLPSGGG